MSIHSRPCARSRAVAVASVVLASGLVLGLAGCGDPDRAILERLAEPERERFLRGRRVATPCWTCHDLAGRVKKIGPSLLGVYGRASGQAPDYNASPAMRAASVVWDDRTLAAYLSNPAGFVPGNRMVAEPIRNAGALSDLLFYLRHVTRPGARDAGGP